MRIRRLAPPDRAAIAELVGSDDTFHEDEIAVALELRDYGRVDFRVAEDGTPYVIDVNPNCDISPDAGVARAARAANMTYPQLIGKICQIAWERYQNAHSKARAA